MLRVLEGDEHESRKSLMCSIGWRAKGLNQLDAQKTLGQRI